MLKRSKKYQKVLTSVESYKLENLALRFFYLANDRSDRRTSFKAFRQILHSSICVAWFLEEGVTEVWSD